MVGRVWQSGLPPSCSTASILIRLRTRHATGESPIPAPVHHASWVWQGRPFVLYWLPRRCIISKLRRRDSSFWMACMDSCLSYNANPVRLTATRRPLLVSSDFFMRTARMGEPARALTPYLRHIGLQVCSFVRAERPSPPYLHERIMHLCQPTPSSIDFFHLRFQTDASPMPPISGDLFVHVGRSVVRRASGNSDQVSGEVAYFGMCVEYCDLWNSTTLVATAPCVDDATQVRIHDVKWAVLTSWMHVLTLYLSHKLYTP